MKVIKLLVTSVLALGLSGCFYQTVSVNDLKRAIIACGNMENVFEISVDFGGGERVFCKDGKVIHPLDSIKLPPLK